MHFHFFRASFFDIFLCPVEANIFDDFWKSNRRTEIQKKKKYLSKIELNSQTRAVRHPSAIELSAQLNN